MTPETIKFDSLPASILGIDSSGTCTGWAEIQVKPSIKLMGYGKIWVIPHGKNFEDDYEKYCEEIVLELFQILSNCKNPIYSAAIEETPSFRGGTVTKMLIGLYQYIRISLYNRKKIPVNTINAKTNKKVAGGNGNASKMEMVAAINKRFGLNLRFIEKGKLGWEKGTDEDAADAIGVAYTLAQELKDSL